MTVLLKHKFTDPKTDGADATIVRPSNWNDAHSLTGIANTVLGFDGSGNAVEVALGSNLILEIFDVKNYGAVGNGVADDTASINSAIAAFNSNGKGRLYFPAGNYLVSGALTAITACGIVHGDGATNLSSTAGPGIVPGTLITCNSNSVSVFTSGVRGLTFADLSIYNIAGATPIAGSAGITAVSTDADCVIDYRSVHIAGFYINIDVQVGASWTMDNCGIYGPVLYGVKIQNTVNADAGDWQISNSNFGTLTRDASAAIRIQTSGGGKIINCKTNTDAINGSKRFAQGIDVAGTGGTSILLIANCSFENFSANAIRVVGSWSHVEIDNCEIAAFVPTCTGPYISMSSTANVCINNIAFAGTCTGDGIYINNVNQVTISNIVYLGSTVLGGNGIYLNGGTGMAVSNVVLNGTITGNGIKANPVTGLVINNVVAFATLSAAMVDVSGATDAVVSNIVNKSSFTANVIVGPPAIGVRGTDVVGTYIGDGSGVVVQACTTAGAAFPGAFGVDAGTRADIWLNGSGAGGSTVVALRFANAQTAKWALLLDGNDALTIFKDSIGSVLKFSQVTDGDITAAFRRLVLAAATTARASINIPSGTAPTSPADGDMWYDGTNVKFRVGGTTKTFTLT